MLRRARGIVAAAEAGGEYELLRAAETIERSPPRTLDGELDPAFGRELGHRHPEAFRLRLREARLAGVDAVLMTPDRRAIAESHYDREQLERSAALSRALPPARRIRGRHMTIATPWTWSHYHWLLDGLPRAALLPLEELPEVPVIVFGPFTPERERALELAGIPRRRQRRLRYRHLVVDELIWPSLTARTGNPAGWALRWLRERLAPAPGGRRRRLYVSRAEAGTRRVVNEEEVLALLSRRGFERILPAQLSLDDQLRAFAEAEAVVAPHGAGLTSMFAAERSVLVELFEPGYVNACYYALCDAAGHAYWYLLCDPAGTGDLRVDPRRLAATLDRALPG